VRVWKISSYKGRNILKGKVIIQKQLYEYVPSLPRGIQQYNRDHTDVCMARVIQFCIFQNVKTCPGAHQASYLVGNMNCFPGSKLTSVEAQATLPHAFMSCTGATLPLPSQDCRLPISFPHTLQTRFVLQICK